MNYKELQIIKHSLQHYLKRPLASQNDIHEEQRLLNKVTRQVEEMREKYGIKTSS